MCGGVVGQKGMNKTVVPFINLIKDNAQHEAEVTEPISEVSSGVLQQ